MKIIGAVLLVSAFGWFGYSLVVSTRRKERLVDALAASLVILRGEITTRLTPLPDCTALLARTGPQACRGFYTDLSAALDALGEVEFADLWNTCLATLELPREARSALADLGRSLGRYSADEQGAAIDRCLEAAGPFAHSGAAVGGDTLLKEARKWKLT